MANNNGREWMKKQIKQVTLFNTLLIPASANGCVGHITYIGANAAKSVGNLKSEFSNTQSTGVESKFVDVLYTHAGDRCAVFASSWRGPRWQSGALPVGYRSFGSTSFGGAVEGSGQRSP